MQVAQNSMAHFFRKTHSYAMLSEGSSSKLDIDGKRRFNLTKNENTQSFFGTKNDTYVVLRFSDEVACVGEEYDVPTVSRK